MDVISWTVAMVVAIVQPSLKWAIAAGVTVSLAIRAAQRWLVEPASWGNDMPEDLLGGLAMILVTVAFAWVGSLVRQLVVRTRGAH